MYFAPGIVTRSEASDRLYFLDWLRILAFGVLVLYHVGMYYVSWDFHVKSPFAGHDLEPWMRLSEPWRMSLLFMLSGAATSVMLKRGANLAFIRSRSARLLKPLLCGVLLIVPPQSYFEVVQKFDFSGGYADFLGLYFTGYKDFCKGSHCLVLPTWNHLWFLPYLWVYTVLLCSVWAVWPNFMPTASKIIDRALNGLGILIIPTAWLFFLRFTLFERHPPTHALWNDGFNHAVYLTVFLIGAVLATDHTLWARLSRWRWPAFGLAVSAWAVLVWSHPVKPLEHGATAIFQWCALVAVFGFAKQHLNRNSRLRGHLNEVVFPLYLLHQTVIIVASQLVLPLGIRPAIEGPMLVLATLTLSYAGYLLVRRLNILRPWFGLKKYNSSPESPSR